MHDDDPFFPEPRPPAWALAAAGAVRCAGTYAPPGGHDLTTAGAAFPLPGGQVVCVPCTREHDRRYAEGRDVRAAARVPAHAPTR